MLLTSSSSLSDLDSRMHKSVEIPPETSIPPKRTYNEGMLCLRLDFLVKIAMLFNQYDHDVTTNESHFTGQPDHRNYT